MDLNACPVPDEDGEPFDLGFLERVSAPHDHIETSVETMRREREERRARMKRDHDVVDDRPVRANRPLEREEEGPQFKKLRHERSRVPPGWLDCPPMGKEVFCMIPSKVPLAESFFNDSCVIIPSVKKYSFQQVFHKARVGGKKLGMVVDLTNTDRYYSSSEFKGQGLRYVKIRCQGRDAVPDNESVNTFVYQVSLFLQAQQNVQREQKKCVLVHCTHGHNRTGFMIVHYLMRTQPISVTEAVQKFAEARPPGIYKPEYIDALYSFYHEARPEWVVCPPTPDWKRGPSDFDLNGEAAVPDDDGNNGPDPPGSTIPEEDHVVMTNDDVLGDKIPDEQEHHLRKACFQLLKEVVKGKGFSRFPGSHPVSLSRENLQLLRQRYYYATWKADGTRYMLLITSDGCYLIDRSFKFRRVQMRFPCKNPNDGAYGIHHCTLLDGEMVIDTISPSKKQERRYLIYDLIAINNVSVTDRPFHERWKMIDKEIVAPRNQERCRINMVDSNNIFYRYDLEPFRVRRKDFWLLSAVGKLLKEFIPRLSHDADGLIFQGWDDPYVTRTHEGLLKWKYPEMNSVDFLFEVESDGSGNLYLYERGKKKLLERNRVTFGEDADHPSTAYSGKIIECSWDSNQDLWVCMRVRADKNIPNEFNTYRKVMTSILDNITEDVLLNQIQEIIALPMYADRIKQDSKAATRNK